MQLILGWLLDWSAEEHHQCLVVGMVVSASSSRWAFVYLLWRSGFLLGPFLWSLLRLLQSLLECLQLGVDTRFCQICQGGLSGDSWMLIGLLQYYFCQCRSHFWLPSSQIFHSVKFLVIFKLFFVHFKTLRHDFVASPCSHNAQLQVLTKRFGLKNDLQFTGNWLYTTELLVYYYCILH